MSAEVVAKIGYDAMLAGKLLVTCDWEDSFLPLMPALLPRRTILKIAENLYTKCD
jgi:hypothetical protein